MATVLLAALANTGGAAHCVRIATLLRDAGHDVVVVTSGPAGRAFDALGFEVHLVAEPAPAELELQLARPRTCTWQLHDRVLRSILDPLEGQWAVVSRLLADRPVDVVVTDPLFLGASMLAALPRATRPAVIMLGLAAPWFLDPGVFPYGMGIAPKEGANPLRVLLFRAISHRAFAKLSRSFNDSVGRILGTAVRGDIRSSPQYADAWLQFCEPRFEYPRRALPANVRFVGPLRPALEETLPEWWDPLVEPPVIVVRSGERSSPLDLVVPALEAFGGGRSTVVVVGMTREATRSAYGAEIPANVHFEDRVPWTRLSPKRTVVIAPGDYVHAQYALQRGIATVLTGTLETDVETAARVAWLHAGIGLRVKRPSATALRDAVETIRRDDSYRSAAARAAVRMQRTDAAGALCALVEELAAASGTPSVQPPRRPSASVARS